ncbi:MAG: FtsQ-type POTRA domain-containing protein [Chlamydiota bacterium]
MRGKWNIKLPKKRRAIVFNVDVARRRRTREARAGGDRSRLRGLGKIAAAAVAAATLGILGTAGVRERFQASPRFTVRWIEVANEELLTKREIIFLSRAKVGDNLITADLAAIRDRLRAHPDIRDAVVSRRVPGGILVRVYERTPIAAVYAGGRYVLDEEGCVLSPAKEAASRAIPSVTGLAFGALRAGDRLCAPAVRRAIEIVKAYHESDLDRQIELVSVDMADAENTVLRTGSIEEIRLGSDSIGERLQLLSFVLKQRRLRGIDGPASYLDLRWKDVAEMPARRDVASMR